MSSHSLFRDVNERVFALAESFAAAVGDGREEEWAFVCECADDRCAERLSLTRDEFVAVRRVDGGFAVCPGHEDGAAVVERHERYSVVVP